MGIIIKLIANSSKAAMGVLIEDFMTIYCLFSATDFITKKIILNINQKTKT